MSRPEDWFARGNDRTPAYLSAVAALKALPADLRERAVAEASADDLRDAWIKSRRVRKAPPGTNYWGRLVGKTQSEQGRIGRNERLPGDDHTSLWLEGDEPVIYVSQPYQLSFEELRNIVQACSDNALSVQVSSRPSWHFPGRVLMLEYTRAPEAFRLRVKT